MTALRRILPAHIRAKCEVTIERLIAFLDAHDSEADDEPSLGFTLIGGGYPDDLRPHHDDDREAEHAFGKIDATGASHR